jgi:hypothetical protein
VASIEVTIGGKAFAQIEQAFDQLGKDVDMAVTESMRLVAPMLMASLYNVARKLSAMHGSPWNKSVYSSSPNLQNRSGQGLASIYKSIGLMAKNGDLVSARISGGELSFHEKGGTIRAKSGGYLTIPLPAAMDGRGVPLKQRARQWDHTFVKRSKKGNLLIFRRLPGARELTPLYILKPSVYIRPRLKMEPTILDEMGYFETRLFERISHVIDQYV